jgi:hypothetical protein
MDTTRPEPLTDAAVEQAGPRPRRWASESCEILAYLALSLLAFLPQSIRPWDTVGYVGDSLDTVWGMGWVAQALHSHPASLFDANELYPHKGTLALSPHRILLGILASPVMWTTGNPVLAYNLVVYMALLLAAVAGRGLARHLGIGRLGSWTAGALYAFHTYQINELPRGDLLFHGLTTLAVLKLLQLLRDGRRRDAWWVALCMWLQGLASNYFLMYGVLVLGLVAAGAVLADARPRTALRRLLTLVAPALVAAACFLPILLPQMHADRVYGLTRGLPRGIDLRLFFATSPANWLYGSINGPVSLQTNGPHFIGFVSLALAVMGFLGALLAVPEGASAALPRRLWVVGAAALAVLFASFCLGRDVVVFGHQLGPGPYRLLYALVPGFDRVRIPERLSLFMMLFVALLVGQGLSWLAARGRWRWLAVALALAVPLEHLGMLATTQRLPVGSQVPEAYRWLAKNPVRAMAEVPADDEAGVRRDTLPQYFSLYHHRPIVHGYVSYQPLMTKLLRGAAVEFPSGMSLALFRRAGVDTVLVHHQTREDDLTAMLADSTARGDLRLLRVFEPGRTIPAPEVRAWPMGTPHGDAVVSVRDEIYQVAPGPLPTAAQQPRGRVERRPAWRRLASAGDPQLAADGNPATRWVAGPRATYEVVFDAPCVVSGIVLPLDRSSSWPRLFLVRGQSEQGDWSTLATVDTPHLLQVLDQLLDHPGWARLGIGWDARPLRQLRLGPSDRTDSAVGWRLSEIEVVVAESQAP